MAPRKRVTAPPKPLDLDKLPDTAHVPSHEVARLTGYAHEYIRKKAKADTDFPQPVRQSGERGPLWFVLGHVRAWMRKQEKEKKAKRA